MSEKDIKKTVEKADEAADIKDDVVCEEQEAEQPTDKGILNKKKQSAEIKKLSALLDEKQKILDLKDQQILEVKDKLFRMAADFDNYKKRTAREMDSRYSDAKGDVLKNFMPVLDNFERAILTIPNNENNPFLDGVKLIMKQISDLMIQSGVEEINALGQPFNPEFHNAVMHVEDENFGQNQVIEVFEKGYKLGNKVLRYSMVKVAN